MSKLPIKIDWTKHAGPNFLAPDGSINDIEDWNVVVRGAVRLDAAQMLSHHERNDKEAFRIAEARCIRMIEDKVYGEIREKLIELRSAVRWSIAPEDATGVMKRYDEIIELTGTR